MLLGGGRGGELLKKKIINKQTTTNHTHKTPHSLSTRKFASKQKVPIQ